MYNEKIRKILEKASELKRLGGLKRHPDYTEIINFTSFLPHDSSVSRRLWHIKNDMFTIPHCKMCDSDAPWEKGEGGYYRTYCSSKCAHIDPDFKEQIKQKNINKTGYVSHLQMPTVRDKIKNTNLQRYGVDNPSKNKEIAKKIGLSNHRAKNTHLQKIKQITQMIDDSNTQRQIGEQLNICQPRVSTLLRNLNLKTNTKSCDSSVQQEITQFIKSIITNDVISNDTSTISPYHIDILIPDLNIGFEINGIHWHSELAGKNRNFHINKTKLCEYKNIQLIHIWDVEWNKKRDIVMSRIKSKLGFSDQKIYARKCQIREINSKTYKLFMSSYHIQGPRPASIKYGLTYNNHLVAVMSFTKNNNEYELTRYASILNVNVIGGASKLLSYFIKQYNPSTIISYADRRWNSGNLYEKLGFKFDKYTQPNYWYFVSNNCNFLYSRVKFQKHKLKTLLASYNLSMTEWENMQNNGYDRIWDCGSSKWIMKK